MRPVFLKLYRDFYEIGVFRTFIKILRFVLLASGYRPPLTRQKIKIGERLSAHLNSTVSNGPFKGLLLNSKSSWSKTDRASMLLGIYEREVTEVLKHALFSRSTFVDFGAADGYYAIGVLKSQLAERAIAFEQSKKSRIILRRSATLNSVSEKLTIHGKADEACIIDLSSNLPLNKSVILFDVEGAEYTLLSEAVFKALTGAVIIVEIHQYRNIGSQEVLSTLINRSGSNFKVKIVKQASRNPLSLPITSMLSDDEAWLLCSEGRGYRQVWAVFEPAE
jgi:hypothetical protein